ncbi:transglutaminase family protein [Candidatus Saccharibacteria bacterium]|nr:transglutaminase family protein [Candidatus Saccharibacteria bacterium]
MKYDYKRRHLRAGLAVFFGIVLIFLAIPWHTQASTEFNYDVNSVYIVNSDSSTRVEESYTVSNNADNKYLDSIQLSTPVEDTKNISVEYTDGTSIPFTVEKKTADNQGYNYEYSEISIKFSRRNVGRNSHWGFVVSYDTNKLIETKGSAHTFNIPSVPQENGSDYSVEIVVPENFGTLHTTGTRPIKIGTKKGQTRYKFENKQQLKKSILLVFGDSTLYEVNYNFPLKNDSSFGSTFTVTLPPNTSGQQVIVQQLDPQPKSTSLDPDGNILADYDVPPRTNITVKTNIIGIVSYLDYNLNASGTKAEIPKDLVARYTKPQQYWPSDNPQIMNKARELTADKKTVAEQVRAINNYVVDTLSYNNEKIKYNIRQGGLKALQNPSNAVCLEYSDLSISLLRAAGIPSRMPIGYGYSGSLKQSNSVSDSLHSWVQAYVPGIGWMNVDPTWSEKFNNFGSSDLDHFAFAIWGVNDSRPAPVMRNGGDINYQYEATTISYRSTPPVLQPQSQLSVNKWLVLPFIALTKYDIQAPTDTAGDNYVLRTRQGSRVDVADLGSLAPKQKITRWSAVIGSTAFGSLNADFTQNGNNSLVLASTKVSSVGWPMWLVIGLLTGIIIWRVVRSNLKRKPTSSEEIAKPITAPIPTIQNNQTENEPKNEKRAKK